MMVVSYDAFGAVPSRHPLNAGLLSDFYVGTAALEALGEADLVAGFGVIDGSETERLILEHAGEADAIQRRQAFGAGARAASRLSCRQAVPQPGDSNRALVSAQILRRRQKAVEHLARSRPNGRMHFGRAVMKLRKWIDGEATVVLDAGSHEIWARTILPSHGPLSFIGSGNWGGMGYALSGLIGARLAVPDRRAVAITGDGCLLMSIADLSTLAEVGGPAVLIIMNNRMYGEIARVQLERFGAISQIDVADLNFAAIPRSHGLRGIRVETEKSLEPSFKEAFASKQPVVIDVACGSDTAFPDFP